MSEQPLTKPEFAPEYSDPSHEANGDQSPRDVTTEQAIGVAQAMRMLDGMPKPDSETGSTPEQQTTMETITAAFYTGQKIIDNTRLGEGFQSYLVTKGIHPYKEADKQPYWNALSTYVNDKLDQKEQKDSKDALQFGALRLLAATPAFIFAQESLDKSVNRAPDGTPNKQVASGYNELIRNFASEFPGVRASGLQKTLLGSLQKTMLHNAPVTEQAADQLRVCIRGAQHELGFSQLLDAARLKHRASTVAEDLKGIDYAVRVSGKRLDIDVKASLHQVSAKKSDGPYVIDRGKVVMYSLIDDHEFGDSFQIAPEAAARKAVVLKQLLAKACSEYYGPRERSSTAQTAQPAAV